MSGTNDPIRLDESLNRVAKELGLPEVRGFNRLMAEWPAIVGEGVAEHAWPRVLRDGILAIDVDGAAWATQLRYLEHEIRRRCAELLGDDEVQAIRVAVSPSPKGEDGRPTPRR